MTLNYRKLNNLKMITTVDVYEIEKLIVAASKEVQSEIKELPCLIVLVIKTFVQCVCVGGGGG